MGRDLIIKSNSFIQAKYNLSQLQVKFLALMASFIEHDDEDFKDYALDLYSIQVLLNIDRKNLDKLHSSLADLMSKNIVLRDDEKVKEMTTIVSYLYIDKETNQVKYRFDKSMKPLLFHLKSNFTKLSLKKILSFDSNYTVRFYEILEEKINISKQYQNKSVLTFRYEIEELKEILTGSYNIKERKVAIPKSYNRYHDFKKRVIEVSKKELEEKGDYCFDYSEIKVGRKVAFLEFSIRENRKNIEEDNKSQYLLDANLRELIREQIQRSLSRNSSIKDKVRYEQALMQKFLKGSLEFDKDLKDILEAKKRNS
jgi:plasmid replication initiation protein